MGQHQGYQREREREREREIERKRERKRERERGRMNKKILKLLNFLARIQGPGTRGRIRLRFSSFVCDTRRQVSTEYNKYSNIIGLKFTS